MSAVYSLTYSSVPTVHTWAAVCRGCSKGLYDDDVFVDLGAAPLANAVLQRQDLVKPETYFPLRALVCRSCLLVQLPQLPDTPAATELFPPTYPFRSGLSPEWLNHCRSFADDATKRFGLGPLSRVLEIGSNDGTGLSRFRGLGIPTMGVEPSREPAQEALRDGVATVIEWWNEAYAKELRSTGYKANLVIARNVLAHVPDPVDFLRGVKQILAPGGTAVIEVPDVKQLIAAKAWDQIYHEHHCYFSLHSLNLMVRRAGLMVVDVEETPMHGGSLRLYLQNQHLVPSQGKVREMLLRAVDEGLTDLKTYQDLARIPAQAKRGAWSYLIDIVRALGEPGIAKRVVGYGASAKAATKLNYYGMGPETIEFIADISSTKWGKYVPGVRIPIRAEQQLQEANPDVVVNFCWNWREQSEKRIRAACPAAQILSL